MERKRVWMEERVILEAMQQIQRDGLSVIDDSCQVPQWLRFIQVHDSTEGALTLSEEKSLLTEHKVCLCSFTVC